MQGFLAGTWWRAPGLTHAVRGVSTPCPQGELRNIALLAADGFDVVLVEALRTRLANRRRARLRLVVCILVADGTHTKAAIHAGDLVGTSAIHGAEIECNRTADQLPIQRDPIGWIGR